MKSTEKIAEKFLLHNGYTDILYEPVANSTPDFLVDGRIAVEVRRLNQNHDDGKRIKGLEEVTLPLMTKIIKIAIEFGEPVDGEAWFFHYTYRRPVETWKSLDPKIKKAFFEFKQSSKKEPRRILKTRGFTLKILDQAPGDNKFYYCIGGYTDADSGGWLLEEMKNNIEHCQKEKATKIEKVRTKYPEWWLVLVDYVGFGLNDFDRKQFKEQITIEHNWDKIVIIDPHNSSRSFEI